MEPKLIDHLLALALVVLAPIEARDAYRRLLAAPQPQGRLRAWRNAILTQWSLAIGLIGWWLFSGRPLPALGIAPSGGSGLAIGIGIFLVVVGFFGSQLAAVKRSGSAREQLRRQLAPVEILMPHNAAETRLFDAVAITAGICEELLYRGFLFWYFAHYGGTVLAVAGSTLVFAVGHLYQGVSGLVKTGIAGLVMAGLRVLTGSLWVPMAVHGAVDLLNGWTAHAALAPSHQEASG